MQLERCEIDTGSNSDEQRRRHTAAMVLDCWWRKWTTNLKWPMLRGWSMMDCSPLGGETPWTDSQGEIEK